MKSRLLAAVIVAMLGATACGSSGETEPTAIDSADPVASDGDADAGPSDGDDDETDDETDDEDGDDEDSDDDETDDEDSDSDDADGRCSADETPDGGSYFVVGIRADDPDGGLIVRAFGSPRAPQRGVLENGTEVDTFEDVPTNDEPATCVVFDDGSVWWEVGHPSLASGGWVNSRFLDKTPDDESESDNGRETEGFGPDTDFTKETLATTAQACLAGLEEACDVIQDLTMSPVGAFARAFVDAVMDGDDTTITQLAEPDIADVFVGTGGFATEDGHGVESIQLNSDTNFSFSWGPTLNAACEITQGVISSCAFGE